MNANFAVQLRHLMAGSSTRRSIAANSGWLLFDRLTRALLGLLVGAWVARHLGPVSFGTLAYVTAFVALFAPFATLSADAIVVRGIAQTPESAPALLGTALWLRAATGLVCWLVAVLFAVLLNDGHGPTILLTAIVGGVLVFQAADTVDLWFQSQAASRRTVTAKLVAYLLSNGVKVGLILGDASLPWFAVVTALEGLAGAVALTLAYRRMRATGHWSRSKSVARGLLLEAWPLMLSGFAIVVYMRMDQIMIKEMLGPKALGIYAVALPISQFWPLIPMTLATSLAPFLARQKVADEAAYRRSIVLVFRAFFYAGVAAVLVTVVTSGWLIPRLFGAAYVEAIPVLNLHVVSNVFCFLGVAHSLWLVNQRRFGVRLWGTTLAGLTTVGLNFLLLPVLGVVGACIAAIAAQAIAAFLINALLDRAGFWLQVEAITFKKVAG